MARSKSKADVLTEIDRLSELSRSELAMRWTSLFRSPPPKGIKRGLLERACACDVQGKAFGGLGRSTRRAILDRAQGQPIKVRRNDRTLRPGTRLVREWHGVVHQVEVRGSSLVWNGRDFRSLSAIARAITGTAWSGPRFFGL
jgi:hypothetical protein